MAPRKVRTWNDRANGYFRSFLRRIFRWSPAYKAARAAAFVERRKDLLTGKWIEYFRCAKCGGVFKRKETHVDHIQPFVSPEHGQDESWDRMRARMSMENAGNLQVLCRKLCHSSKSSGENRKRRKKSAETDV